MYNTEYVIATEHQLIQNNHVVDSTISYNTSYGPKNEEDAIEFFSKTRKCKYTNIYGITNKTEVVGIYKRIAGC